MYKVVRTSRLYEQIVQQIEDSILKGTLKAGDQLPSERELALKFGVSRTAVREAVKALHEKGLVEAYSGRGTFITDGTTEAVRQSINLMMRIDQAEGSENLAEVRQILEPEIAALAATRIQEPQLVLMREAFTVMNDALKDPDAYIEADLDFHLALAEAAENSHIFRRWRTAARPVSPRANFIGDRTARRGSLTSGDARPFAASPGRFTT